MTTADQDAPDLTPAEWQLVNEAVSWDDRKTLADLWQQHAPLPDVGLSDGFYDALLAVARYGATRVAEEVTDR